MSDAPPDPAPPAASTRLSTVQALWRPLTGWVLLIAIASQTIVRPVFNWIAANLLHMAPMERLDMDMLVFVATVSGVLVASRTTEKINGVS